MYKKNSFGKYQCPCCDYYTLRDSYENTFEICEVCYWENDGIQFSDPDYEGGANAVSLNQARQNFKKLGTSEACFTGSVRQPTAEE